MSNGTSDPISTIQTNYNNAMTFFKAAGLITEDIPLVGTLFSIAEQVYNAFAPKDNQMQVLLQNILKALQSGVQALSGQEAATAVFDALLNYQQKVAQARTVLDQIPMMATEQPPPLPQDITNAIAACESPLQQLAVPEAWTLPFSDYKLYWSDPEGKTISDGRGDSIFWGYQFSPKPDSLGDVFNYWFVLPNYLRCLSIFITLGLALDGKKTFVANYGGPSGPIQGAAALLKSVHDKAVSGINFLTGYVYSSTIPWTGQSLWQAAVFGDKTIPQTATVSLEYGAVEMYSGVNSVGHYKVTLGPPGPTGSFPTNLAPGSTDSAPYNKFRIRLLRRGKDVYKATGMLTVWQTINTIYSLVGMPQMPRPNYGDWSVRRDLVPVAKPPVVNGKISLLAIAKFIKYTPPGDTPAQQLFTSLSSLVSV